MKEDLPGTHLQVNIKFTKLVKKTFIFLYLLKFTQ